MVDVTKIVDAIKEIGNSDISKEDAAKAFRTIQAALDTAKGKFDIDINFMRDLIKHD